MSDRKGKHGKKRKKSYYIKCAHKKPRRESNLGEDMKGFLVTCNNNEKQAVREMYNILNEYADKMYGPEEYKEEGGAMKDEDDSGSDEEEDMDKAMEKEINAMKNMKPAQRRFQNVNTKAKNCIFIKTSIEDPCRIIHNILSDLADSGVQKTRYAIRALPVQGTCKAHISDIEKLAKELFKSVFQTPFGTGYRFSIVFKCRNNNGLGRMSVIPPIAQIVSEMNPLHKVNHDNPDFVVLVEIVGTVCCLSVLKDFHKFRKYNLQEVTRPKEEVTQSKINNIKDKESKVEDTGQNEKGEPRNNENKIDESGYRQDKKDGSCSDENIADESGCGQGGKDEGSNDENVADESGCGQGGKYEGSNDDKVVEISECGQDFVERAEETGTPKAAEEYRKNENVDFEDSLSKVNQTQ